MEKYVKLWKNKKRKLLRIRLAWHNSNKRVSSSFKWRESHSVAVMRYGCYAKGFQFDSHLVDFIFFFFFSGLLVIFMG